MSPSDQTHLGHVGPIPCMCASSHRLYRHRVDSPAGQRLPLESVLGRRYMRFSPLQRLAPRVRRLSASLTVRRGHIWPLHPGQPRRNRLAHSLRMAPPELSKGTVAMSDSDRYPPSTPSEPSPGPASIPDFERGRAPDGGPVNPPPPPSVDEEIIQLRAEIARVSRLAYGTSIPGGLEDLREQIADARAAADRHAADVLASARRDAAALVGNLRREMTDAVADQLRVIDTTLHEHHATLQRVLARVGRNQNVPVAWHSLNTVQAAGEWSRLAEWLDDVFVPWIEITRGELPDCWALHRTAVIQLSWLRTTQLQAYSHNADPTLAAEWNVRWAPAALNKIRIAITDDLCRPGEHMITTEESNRRRRAAAEVQAQSGALTRAGGTSVELARRQLATREHWDRFFVEARDRDLRLRRERDVSDRGNSGTHGGDVEDYGQDGD